MNDRNHRESFLNYKLVDELNDKERKAVEGALIELLYEYPQDILIMETLSYMKSSGAIPAISGGIIIAFSIYDIKPAGPGIYTKVEPDQARQLPGGGREATIGQPFPVFGGFILGK